jgi:hypothetical protein
VKTGKKMLVETGGGLMSGLCHSSELSACDFFFLSGECRPVNKLFEAEQCTA